MDFAVLGPLEVSVQGHPLLLGGQKQRAMLATLLLHANRVVADALLTYALWRDDPPKTSGDNLRLYASRLRRLLGPDRVIRRHGGYQVLVHPGELDAARFEEHADRGRLALRLGDHEKAAHELHEALRLWRGPAYADLRVADELSGEAARLDELRLQALESRIEADLKHGMGGELIAELTGHTREYPLRERFHEHLMTALAGEGRTAEALTVYAETSRILADELGVDPSPDLRRLHQRILTADARPILGDAPAELPMNVIDFAGRDDHVAELLDRLGDRSAVPVSVITGMGGIGKTALALQVAHRVARRFPGGQLYVDLRGTHEEAQADPGQVLGRFLVALGVPGSSLPETIEERAAVYRSRVAHRAVLVVLDNAASERQIRPLLPGVPGCAVLVTSRARLSGLEGAWRVDLGVLREHEAVSLLTQMIGQGRVAAQPADAIELVRLCDQMPLAVRIAGARLAARPERPIAWLVGRLRDERGRLNQLVVGDRAVRASLALSYVGLSPLAQRAFRLLGLLNVPDFAGWVPAALLDHPQDEGEALLDELVDAQLVTLSGLDTAGQARYRCHDLVRLYARERAETEEDLPALRLAIARALGGWLGLARRAAAQVPGACYALLHSSAPQWPVELEAGVEPLAWFDAERAALASLVEQAGALGFEEHAWDLAGCMERYFDVRGLFAECRRVNELAMLACRAAGNPLGEAVMLRGLLDVTTWMGIGHEGGAMVALHTNAARLVTMFEQVGERRGMSDAYVMCAWGLAAQGFVEPALEAAYAALRLAEETGHLGGQARAYLAIGLAHGQRRVADAIPFFTSARGLAERLGNPRFEATVLQFLGLAYVETGQLRPAEQCLSRSLVMARAASDPSSEAMTLVSLAKLYARDEDPRAVPTADLVADLSRRYNLAHHLADALWVRGDLALAAGDGALAVAQLTESVALWRARRWSVFLAGALVSLARAHRAVGADEAASAAGREAHDLFTAVGDTDGATRALAI